MASHQGCDILTVTSRLSHCHHNCDIRTVTSQMFKLHQNCDITTVSHKCQITSQLGLQAFDIATRTVTSQRGHHDCDITTVASQLWHRKGGDLQNGLFSTVRSPPSATGPGTPLGTRGQRSEVRGQADHSTVSIATFTFYHLGRLSWNPTTLSR